MTIERLVRVLGAIPFVPFRLWLADGQRIDVRHREQVTDLRGGRTVCVACSTATARSSVFVDLLLVVAIEIADEPVAIEGN